MPRLTTRVPKYCLHRASGQAMVRLGGRDIYLGPYGSDASKAKYGRLVAEWSTLQTRRDSPSRGPDGLTVDELILAYLEHAAAYYLKNGTPTSMQQQIRSALRPLHELYGTTLAAGFGPLALKKVRHAYCDEYGWCRSTVNAAVGIVKRMFKWASENELVAASVYHGLQTVSGLRRGRCPVRESEPVGAVSEPHVEAILAHVSRQVAAMIQLQLLTGMRPGEVVIMRGCDLDTSGKVWTYMPESHKTEHHGKKRVIYLGPQAQDTVKPFLQKELTAYLFSPAEAQDERNRRRRENRKSPMTPSQRARKRKTNPQRAPRDRYTPGSYRVAILRACDKVFPSPKDVSPQETKVWRKHHRWHPNQLRHTAATKLRKEFGIEAARVVLGHSSAAVTEVYAELDLMKAADVMGRIG